MKYTEGFILLINIIFSLISRKKAVLFFSLLAIGACNACFFAAAAQKQFMIEKYTAAIPKFSNQDIYVVSSDTNDILNLKPFSFPHSEKIKGHDDVLGMKSLQADGDNFIAAIDDPNLVVISLKKDASVKKWLDTFEKKSDLLAIHSSVFKQRCNKAIIARNEALCAYSKLLDLIYKVAFVGIVISATALCVMFRKEIWTFLLEGVWSVSAICGFAGTIGAIALTPTFITLFVGVCLTDMTELLCRLFIYSVAAELITSFVITSLIVTLGRSYYGQSRVF